MATREARLRASRNYTARNREKINEASKAYRAANPDKIRDLSLRYYGITAAQFDALYAEQGGRCKICDVPIPAIGKGRHLDHCHATNRIRGILCPLCNFGLGKFGDSPEALRAAATYIETASTPYVVARPDRLNRPASKKRAAP